MIAHALTKVEDGKGGFMQICDIIEKEFSPHLNWKLERCVMRDGGGLTGGRGDFFF